MRVVFIGAGEIGIPVLRWLLDSKEHDLAAVVTQPDKPAGRDQKMTPPPIKSALAGKNISILQPGRIKDREAIEQIRALAPDAIVVMAYGQILPKDILEIPKKACLNLHASLLPRHRGASPIQAAIVSGDAETGITVIYMAEGLDTGDMLLQRKIDISPDDTGDSLHDRLAQIAPEALRESLRLLAAGNAPRIAQDNALATYAPKLKRDDGKIDWTESVDVIERKIRAFNPWPGAFTMLGEKKLKILGGRIVDLPGEPGTIIRSDNELVIAARDHALSLTRVQREGKRPMSAAEFLRGNPLSSRTT
jgi:methionyl-tRNA formyltransferase